MKTILYCGLHPFLLLLLFSEFISASTYYVSTSGSDQNTGTGETAALATLSFARTKLHSGDTLLLRRGDVFRDSLDCSALANPVIGSYGPANLQKPVVSASVIISGWALYKGSIWVATCPRKIEKLFANNTMMTLARYPDTGWLRVDTMTENIDGSNTVITIAALAQHTGNAAGYWNNAQIRWRRWSWWFETRRVSSYEASGRLSLTGKSIIHIDPANGTRGWGFYIDNKLEEIDAAGEWFCDAVSGKVYFFPPGGGDPNTMLVEGACLATGITLAGGTVDNICLRHQTLNGISLSRTSAISNCRFEGIGGDSGGTALRASWDIANSHIFSNVFENNLNIGISWYENAPRKGLSVIEYDTLINTGSIPGYGGSGTWHGIGILVHLSSNVQVRYNYLDTTGYAGILLGSDSNFVYCNIIKNAMWTLNDGGAIYTDCSRSFIHNNIIYDTKGDLTSSGPWYPLGHGIWLEFLGDFHQSVVANNTVVRSGCNGIYLPNNFSDTIRNNVLFDNTVSQLCLDGQLTNSSTGRTQNLPQNNLITGNVCYAASPQERALEFRPEYTYGTLAGNYFCNPNTDSVVSGYGTGNKYYSLSNYTLGQWRLLYPWADASAKTDPIKRPRGMNANKPYGKGVIFINETPLQKTFPLGAIPYKDLDNNVVAGSLTVAPYFSKIVVCSDSTLGIKNAGITDNYTTFKQIGTMLQYGIAKRSSVSLFLFDQAGRQVYHSANMHREPGTYLCAVGRTDGNRKKISQGIYNYRFDIAHDGKLFTKTGKIVVVK
jgi:parallel beta-helix repeat protein